MSVVTKQNSFFNIYRGHFIQSRWTLNSIPFLWNWVSFFTWEVQYCNIILQLWMLCFGLISNEHSTLAVSRIEKKAVGLRDGLGLTWLKPFKRMYFTLTFAQSVKSVFSLGFLLGKVEMWKIKSNRRDSQEYILTSLVNSFIWYKPSWLQFFKTDGCSETRITLKIIRCNMTWHKE